MIPTYLFALLVITLLAALIVRYRKALRLNRIAALRRAYDRLIAIPLVFPIWYRGAWLLRITPKILIQGHEPETVRFLRSYVQRGWTVADVGVHFGVYTVLLRQLVGAEGTVVAFEPNLGSFLRGMKWINRFKNIDLVGKAVSDVDGPVKFYRRNRGTDSLIEENSRGGAVVVLDSVTLDEYFKDRKVHFIKIDAEGAELPILRGAERLIKEGTTFTIELSPKNLQATGKTVLSYLDEVRSLGLEILWINADGTIRPIVPEDASRIQGHANVFCRPRGN